ncbi:MAG: hypothetical protein IT430_17910 [Phycisphaerales bacterium]|nr:hypothetical protein [Phycisphaerales bacterium]
MRTTGQRFWVRLASGTLLVPVLPVLLLIIVLLIAIAIRTSNVAASLLVVLAMMIGPALLIVQLVARSRLRAHLRRHDLALCPNCWYELDNPRSKCCPECGARITRCDTQTYWFAWLDRPFADVATDWRRYEQE